MAAGAEGNAPATFVEKVFPAELKYLHRRRESCESLTGGRPVVWGRGDGAPPVPVGGAEVPLEKRRDLVGLAFSGGGIRSATFNLGLLQALARGKVLHLFDYLSTVSGGGYIGTWLAGWSHRRGGLRELLDELTPAKGGGLSGDEPREIGFLRDHGSYLAPRRQILGADFWTVIMTYLRNTQLNQIVLVLSILALLLVPRLLVHLFKIVGERSSAAWSPALLVLAAALVFLGIFVSASNLRQALHAGGPDAVASDLRILKRTYGGIIVPLLLAAWFLSSWIWVFRRHADGAPVGAWALFMWAVLGGGAYAGMWWIALLGPLRRRTRPSPVKGRRVTADPKEAAGAASPAPFTSAAAVAGWAFVPGAAVGAACFLLTSGPDWFFGDEGAGPWRIAAWGVPLVILLFTLSGTLHIGLAGGGFSESAREWWSRLGATLVLTTLGVAALTGLAVYGPWLLEWSGAWINSGLASGWALTSVAGAWVGRSAASGFWKTKGFRKIIVKASPYVFVAGLAVVLSWIADRVALRLPGVEPATPCTGGPGRIPCEYWSDLNATLDPSLWIACAVLAAVALVLSRRMGINRFSMHAMYRNRLVRCYMGASNEDRRPDPFTGFDPGDDDLKVADLTRPATGPSGEGATVLPPYPIINTALNLTSGEKRAWQERKAASFVFTPEYCGYVSPAIGPPGAAGRDSRDYFRRTGEYAGSVSLGTAMAISGAAASPNMGYHSSAPLAFLMTMFNVRLGWWLKNPRYESRRSPPTPASGLLYLLCELLGVTNDRRGYVYLSDGGHFENLAVYELLRRRCKYILVSDAGEDPDFRYEDLVALIRKARIDFQTEIDIKVSRVEKDKETGWSRFAWAAGTVTYPGVEEKGVLVYLKPTLTGLEPKDVLGYRGNNPKFPHQPTVDQFFDEAQFESYRRLGLHIGEAFVNDVFPKAPPQFSAADLFGKALEKASAA